MNEPREAKSVTSFIEHMQVWTITVHPGNFRLRFVFFFLPRFKGLSNTAFTFKSSMIRL